MSDTTILLATLAVYLAVLLGIGVAAGRRTTDDDDFFLGGRRAGPLVAAVGAAASSSSAWTLLGVSGAAYAWGISAVWLIPACVGGFVFNWYVMAPALRRASHERDALTMVELLAGERGARGRGAVVVVAAAIILVSMGAYVAAQFQGAGKTFHAVFDVEVWEAVAVGAAIVLAYLFLGGFRAVSWSDTLQGLVMAATAVALPAAAVVEVGGIGALADAIADLPPELTRLGGPRAPILAAGFVAGVLGIGLGYPGQPHVLKYFMAMRRDRDEVRRARAFAITWAVLVFGGMVLLGLSGRALYPALGDREVVFVVAAHDLFHPVVAGVMLAAVLSAMMSTADSQLLVASSTVSHDLGAGRRELARSRVIVVALTIGAAAAALVGSDEIFSRVLFGWAAMGAAFGPLLIVCVVRGRTMAPARVAAVMATGAGLAAVAHLALVPLGGPADLRLFASHVVPFAAAFALAFAWSRERS